MQGRLDTFLRFAAADLPVLGLDFEAFAWALNKYREAGGSVLVLEFYDYRYKAIACWLDAICDLSVHHQFQQFFKPAETRRFLLPATEGPV